MLGTLLPLLLLLTAGGCGDAKQQDQHGVAAVGEARRELPPLTGRVLDMADLLTNAAETDLADKLEALERVTSDELVVVTLPSLEGESIESFAMRLGNGWGIGQEKLDNGVLLIVAPAERKVRIEVGLGLEGLLTDEGAKAIIQERLIPQFRAGKFEEGIDGGAAAIVATLTSDKRRPRPKLTKREG